MQRTDRNGATALGVLVSVAALGLSGVAQASDRYAAIVIDARTQEVLLEDQADEARFPASLTKMMTLYMLFDALDRGEVQMSTRLPVSRRASRMPATRLGLRRGDTITVEQAIQALVVQSANDVAVVVAERLGGSESRFGALMTQRARTLGMTNTRFVNASGLPDVRQRSTARDMAMLGQAIWREYPEHYHYFSSQSWTFRNRDRRGHNHLLGSVDGVDGIKTGYTRASGFNLVSSAERNGRRVMVVVMGGESAAARDNQVAYLIEGAYEEYARRELDNSGVSFASLPTQRLDVQLSPGYFGGVQARVSPLPVGYAAELGLAPGISAGAVVETLGPSRGLIADPDYVGGDDPDMSTEEPE
jgi:D-alanyl-D-alanine carboxypeptidase